MKFANPNWLYGLVIILLFYVFIIYDEKRRKTQFLKFAQESLWSRLVPEMNFGVRLKKAQLLMLSFLFFLLALARPQYGTHEEVVHVVGLDIMVVLDLSNSMYVADVVPNRLEKAKHLIRSLVGYLEGDRVGVIGFAGSTYIACPLTTDLDYVLSTVQLLSPKSIVNQGTDIEAALETATQALERGAEEASGPDQTSRQSSRVVLLLTDGEDHEGKAQKIAAKMKNDGVRLYVMGVGTTQGGPIPIQENHQTQGFKKDHSGKIIVSALQSQSLEELAALANGKYWLASASEGELMELLKDVGALTRGDYAERRYVIYDDQFQIPLAIALILLLFEMSIGLRKRNAAKILFIMCLLFGPSAFAEEWLKKSPAQLDTYLNNQEGLKEFQKGNLEGAQEHFSAAQARDPNLPELEFNQGVIQYDQGEVDRAIEYFSHALKGAEQRKDTVLHGKAAYNLGNSFAKKGVPHEAIRSYLEALQDAKKSKNSEFENRIRKNIQLLMNEEKNKQQKNQDQKDDKKQQEQKQSDKQQQKNQNNKEKEDKKNQSHSADQQKNDSQKKDSNDSQENKKQESDIKKDQEKQKQFKSEKMDGSDADRVLSELKKREQDLREKLNNKNVRGQNHAQDW